MVVAVPNTADATKSIVGTAKTIEPIELELGLYPCLTLRIFPFLGLTIIFSLKSFQVK